MTAHETTADRAPDDTTAAPDRTPLPALLMMALACFGAVLVENLPAGMLPAISVDLGVSEPAAGALVWVFALTSAVTALPLVTVARAVPRRPLLVLVLVGFTVASAATAGAPSYGVALLARIVAGVATGVLWSMLAGYAARVTPAGRTGTAVAVVLGGSTVALSFGLPAGALVGAVAGWRTTFWLLAALGVLLVGAALTFVPDVPGDDGASSARAILTRRGMGAVAVASLAVGAGHNALYTFVAPFLAPSAPPGGVVAALLVFGVAAVAGNVLAGRLLDRHLRGVALVATGGLALVLAAMGLVSGNGVATMVAVALWGVVFGTVPAAFQTAALRVSGENSEVAVSVAITTYNVGIASGAAAGGVVFAAGGVGAVPWLACAVTVPALVVVAVSRRAGFPATPPARRRWGITSSRARC